ncbi:MAG: nicotinate-nicotinamide nucleotide adenylyltransferase [Candidatus Latescibacteria bacterium]|nr:nicotinate-nicotinamide nucleotide adenylyltransferase [Candidatus Latescibacterota bacterium]
MLPVPPLWPSRAFFIRVIDSLDPDGPPRMELILKAERGIFMRPGRLGVLSSSFNPPTTAHVMMVEQAKKTYALHEVLLLLSMRNVDKPLLGAPLEDRLSMVVRFAIHNPILSVGATTHALLLDQTKAFLPWYPPETEVFWVVGFDTFVRILDPTYYTDPENEIRRLFDTVHLIVVSRGSQKVDDVKALLDLPSSRSFADRIRCLELDPFHAHLSSTEVRRRVAANELITDLVPPEVATYIREHGLYRPHTDS